MIRIFWMGLTGCLVLMAAATIKAADEEATTSPHKPNLIPPATRPYCENGFTPIFNGKDLDDWVYGTSGNQMKRGAGYQVKTEEQIVYCTVKDGGNLYTKKEYANFILRLEFKLTENANNGIGIRAPLAGHASYMGMEIQVLDDYGSDYKSLRPEQYCGSLYDVFAAETGYLKPVGQWNSEEIMADGRHVSVILNGHIITDAQLETVTDPKKLQKHPGLLRKIGHIGFLGHDSAVEFRNLRIKELPDTVTAQP